MTYPVGTLLRVHFTKQVRPAIYDQFEGRTCQAIEEPYGAGRANTRVVFDDGDDTLLADIHLTPWNPDLSTPEKIEQFLQEP